ncbi:hypothetical protein MLD38_008207 [Melastoma candidum]|uniref:Uncharacterized protein n=1 Tax=Melastoma candidum TaxID=119954 RepID=A0ACB9RUU4_9MYRT|nr:hypothetical protein MLD38_008207 [Melastoma candidum]
MSSTSAIPNLSIRFISPAAWMDDTPSPTLLTPMHDTGFSQGITSVLSPTKSIPSLRRTLSADMSSRNWVPHDEFWPSKGLDHLPHHAEVEDEEDKDGEGSRFDIWNSIQEEKRKVMLNGRGREGFDAWGSIASRNVFRRSESETLPTQYVPPLMRRSSSCLSEKSLEICTERLGSETGSDCFLSFPPSETRRPLGSHEEDRGVKNGPSFSSAFGPTLGVHAKRSSHAPAAIPRSKQGSWSFPPPIPSLSPAADGGSLRMQSRRENGRLVLEAVSVPSQKTFQARRENGRLVLEVTAPDAGGTDLSTEEQEEAGEVEEGRGNRGGNDVAEKEGTVEEGLEWIIRKKTETTVEIAPSYLRIDRIGKLTIPKIAFRMNEPDEVMEVVFFKGGINGVEVEINPMATVTNPENAYEYFWRMKGTTVLTAVDPVENTVPPPTLKSYLNAKKYVISRNNSELTSKDRGEVEIPWKEEVDDCWVSVMKDSRRRKGRPPLFASEPRCIATS